MHSLRLLVIPVLSVFFTLAVAFDAEPRSLDALSDAEIVALARTPDPIRHLDPYDPNSHLYKILIPRPRKLKNRYKPSVFLYPASGYGQQHDCSQSHRLYPS